MEGNFFSNAVGGLREIEKSTQEANIGGAKDLNFSLFQAVW